MKAAAVFVLFLVSLLSPFSRAGAEAVPCRLTYTVGVTLQGGSLRLGVDLSFPGDAAGRTRLHLPCHFSGQQALYENVQSLAAAAPGVTLADTDAPDVKQVTYPPGQTVRIHYEIVPGAAEGRNQPGAYFRPALQPSYFHFIGATVWAYPSQYAGTLSATLHWRLPAGWAFCGSLGPDPAAQSFQGTLEQFLETVSVGGDFRTLTVEAGGKPVTVALRGKWKFSDGDFAALAGRIVAAERDFWRDTDFPYYLVTLMPANQPETGVSDDGGVELTHSIALFQPKTRTLDFGLKYVLAHELFHTWNADQIQARDTPLYWFSEGFTDYYARLLLLRAGLISLDDYAREFNRVEREYTQSPCRNRRGSEAAAGFYSGTALARLPYQQGALLAAHWDAAIRQATAGAHSLGDVMRDLRSAAAPVTEASIAAAINRYSPVDAVGDIQRVVTDGGTLLPDPAALGPGFTLRTVSLPPFELGFDGPATVASRTVTKVKPGSHAFWAGLRDGQEVVACAPFVLGDTNQRLSLTVRDIASGTKEVEFTPAGDGLPVPQYVRAKAAASDEACLMWIGNLSPPPGR